MNNIFSKEFQTALKNIYEQDLKKYWKTDKMTKFCMGEIGMLIPICDGKYICQIDKGRIEKDFCFGYSDCGQGRSYEENNEHVSAIEDNMVEYFIEKNMASIDRQIKAVEDYLKTENCSGAIDCMYHFAHYCGQDKNSTLRGFTFCNYWNTPRPEYVKLEYDDARLILEGLLEYRKIWEKKVNTYIKKYGMTKVHISTYWIDR